MPPSGVILDERYSHTTNHALRASKYFKVKTSSWLIGGIIINTRTHRRPIHTIKLDERSLSPVYI